MHRKWLPGFAIALGLWAPHAASAQALNACDLNADGVVDSRDVQLATAMSLGLVPCMAEVAGPAVCNIVVVQRITNATHGGPCLVRAVHSASLSWTPSVSPDVVGYKVYRGAVSGGPYTQLTAAPVAAASYTDYTVQSRQTYYYVVTAVDSSGNESGYSNEAQALIPK
jgi:hypothetical protein